ncbi:major facilitator superfamily domain-containing protein [Pilaira anomala]|nr:major facilitator superfamily domain-containing protein [Pilaira anomala]
MIPRPSRKVALTCSFIAALIVANVSGPQYIYPTFGTSLKERFQWSGLENSFVSTAIFVGVSFSGPLCAWMIENLGITKTLRVSAFLIFSGPFLVAQTYAGRLYDSYILCTLYFMCTGLAGAAAYLCALDSQAHNFKQRRGLSMGLTTASVGTCGIVFSQINDVLFGNERYETDAPTTDDSTYNFLIFLAFSMSFGIFLGSFFLGPVTDEEDATNHSSTYQPIVTDEEQQPLTAAAVVEISPLLEMIDSHDILHEFKVADEISPLSGIQFLKHPIGFSLFCTMFVILGVGYVYLANIGQILDAVSSSSSVSGDQHTRNLHITLFSLGNCLSRAVFGALSDTLRNKFGIHRLWIFVFAILSLLATLTYLVSATTTTIITPDSLVPCTLIISTAYGIAFGVAPATTTEFGTDVFARNWGLLLFAPAFGSQIFNVLFGVFYGRQAGKQGSPTCHGSVCFVATFRVGIMCGLLALSILSVAIYKAGLYKRRIPLDNKLH